MKKSIYLIAIVLFSLLVFSGNVSAKTTMTNLEEAVSEELATFDTKDYKETYKEYIDLLKKADFSEYSESDEKVNVYIFRGSTCWHCLDEISWFASQVKENGKYFNVYTYEVWNNSENNKLMTAVAKSIGESADGVPFTVIGNKAYSGFGEDLGNQMLTQIKSLYDTNIEDRYDIKDYINLEDASTIKEKDKKSSALTVILIVLVLAGGIGLIYYVSKS